MPIEKVDNQIYVVYKSVFDEELHTIEYAIGNGDTGLIDYLLDNNHYTFSEYKRMLEYCITRYNNMFEYMIRKLENHINNDNTMYIIIQYLREDLIIKNKKINEYLDKFLLKVKLFYF